MPPSSATLDELFATILSRKGADPSASYTASLLAGGAEKCAQKLGEEAIETVIAALGDDNQALANEAADLVYHLWVTLAVKGVTPGDVYRALDARTGQSGLQEKAARSK